MAALAVLPGAAIALDQKVVASDPAQFVQLGYSVAVDGDTVVVGARLAGNAQGAVYVYTREGNSWSQSAKLTASDGATNDRLGESVPS